MKTGYQQHWIEYDGVLTGICLGGDHTAEHEMGIKPILDAFQVYNDVPGVDRLVCHRVPELHIRQGTIRKQKAMIVAFSTRGYSALNRGKTILDDAAYCQLPWYLAEDGQTQMIATSWDDHSFAILACGKDEVAKLEQFLSLAKAEELCISMGTPKTPFAAAGLNLLLRSKIPEQEKSEMMKKDIDAINLYMAVKRTRIEKILKKAGKEYYALLPRWEFESERGKSRYKVRFFLNPKEQSKNNYGWFTVEELKLWAKGKGPIPKTA